jgi:hypothetical protein
VFYTGAVQQMYWFSIYENYVIWYSFYQHCFCDRNRKYTISLCRSFYKTAIAKTFPLYPSLGHACMSYNAVKVRQNYVCIKILSKILKMVPWLFPVIFKTVLRITFKIFICYLTCPNKYNAYAFPWKWVFISIYFEQFVFLLSAVYICSLYFYM